MLNRPVFGTQARKPSAAVRVEGRISDKAVKAISAALMAGLVANAAGWIAFSSYDPFKFYTARANLVMCESIWGGYSKGMLALAALLCVLVLPFWILLIYMWREAEQLIRKQTNMPPSGRPWFPIRLIEGAEAVKRGKILRLEAVGLTGLLVWITFWQLPQVLRIFLVSPSNLKGCG